MFNEVHLHKKSEKKLSWKSDEITCGQINCFIADLVIDAGVICSGPGFTD